MATGRQSGGDAHRPNAQGNEGTVGTPIRDPDEWKTGDEPMTAAQRSYLHTLALEAGETLDDDGLTKAEAAKRIEDLQQKTGRGQAQGGSRAPEAPRARQ